jgi:hypothetical protein
MGGMGSVAQADVPKVMIRSLDFTVEADYTYRYRLRIVVKNPNHKWETVSPGVDTQSEELKGPWSDPTEPVSIPDDVTTYTKAFALNPRNKEQVSFQVAKFDPEEGLTIVKDFDAGPGDIIGEKASALVPEEIGKEPKAKQVDFTSHQLVLDTEGGEKSLDALGRSGRFETPAEAIVLRSDGILVVRDQALDHHNTEMARMKNIYKRSVDEARSNTKRKKKNESANPYMNMMRGAGRAG